MMTSARWGVAAAQAREVGLEDRAGHERLDGDDGRAAAGARTQQRELAERVTGPEHRERHALAVGRGRADGGAAAFDQVDGLGRVALVEDDLVALERPPPRDLERAPQLVPRDPFEQAPLHRRKSAYVANATPVAGGDRRRER